MQVVGIDIGGTKIALGLFRNAELIEETVMPTRGYEESLAAILGWLGNKSFGAIGLGSPGPVDEAAGEILIASTMPGWHHRPVCQDLRLRTDKPAALLNDADAALLGEIGGYSVEPVVMLTFGTGVGGAAWTNGSLVHGAYGEHPEIGHMPVFSDGSKCYCGQVGCLEAEASGSALNARIRDEGRASLQEAIDCGSPAVERARAAIGRAIWNLAHVYRPERIVLGGGLMEDYFDGLVPIEELGASDTPSLVRPLRVVKAKLGNKAGIYGAAAHARRMLL